MTTLTKSQKTILTKAFRLIKSGATHGETIAYEGDLDEAIDHVDAMFELLQKMKDGLAEHRASANLLERIEINRVETKHVRPKLTLVKS